MTSIDHRRKPHRGPYRIRQLVGCVVVLTIALTSWLSADGDPLEEYDYSGQASLESFTQRIDSRIYQHDLWTIQQMTELDPFDGGAGGRKTWALKGNRSSRVGIYYGTRPMWVSEESYRASLRSLGGSENQPEWKLVSETEEPEPLFPVSYGYGGPSDLCIVVASGDMTGRWLGYELIRLEGDQPANAKVTSLWRGRADLSVGETFVNLDDDPELEIIVTRFSVLGEVMWGTYPVRLPWILDWNPEAEQFIPANDRLLHAARRASTSRGQRRVFHPAGREADSAVDAAKEILSGAERAWDSQEPWESQFFLVRAVLELIASGDLAGAKEVVDRYPREILRSSPDRQYLTKAEFWSEIRSSLTRDPLWPELKKQFPSLVELEREE